MEAALEGQEGVPLATHLYWYMYLIHVYPSSTSIRVQHPSRTLGHLTLVVILAISALISPRASESALPSSYFRWALASAMYDLWVR